MSASRNLGIAQTRVAIYRIPRCGRRLAVAQAGAAARAP